MSATRRFLVALAGTEDPALPEQVAQVAGTGGPAVEVTLLHVVETGPRELAAYQPAVRRGPWPLPKKDAIEGRSKTRTKRQRPLSWLSGTTDSRRLCPLPRSRACRQGRPSRRSSWPPNG